MSVLWPRSEYADDQLYGKAILTLHVLDRGFQAGAIIGGIVGCTRYLWNRRRVSGLLFAPGFINAIGVGAVIGTVSTALILPVRMWNRDLIEWQDRSWRLLANKGQVAVDTFSTTAGLAVAGILLARQGRYYKTGWRSVMGGFGLGNLGGISGYMLYRYAMHKGEFATK